MTQMNQIGRFAKKVAVVTGAGSGIGASTTTALLRDAKMIVAGLTNALDSVCALKNKLPKELQGNLHPVECDVTSDESVRSAFCWVEKNLGGPDVLVNNAGLMRDTEIVRPGNYKDMKAVIDVNLMGVVLCTREAFNSMKARKSDGHVVCMNSIAGHQVPNFLGKLPSYNIYPATKFAITALVESLRQEFIEAKTNVRITSISPGATDTGIFPMEVKHVMHVMLKPEDITNAIMFALSVPPHVQIYEIIIKPVGEAC